MRWLFLKGGHHVFDEAPSVFGVADKLLHDLEPVGVGKPDHVLPFGRPCQGYPFKGSGKKISALPEALVLQAFQHVGLEIVFDVLQVLSRADEPVEMCEIFDVGQLAMTVVPGFGLGPTVLVIPLALVPGDADHVADDGFAVRVRHAQQVFPFKLRSVRKELFNSVQGRGEKIPPAVVVADGAQRFADHLGQFFFAFPARIVAIKIVGHRPRFVPPVRECRCAMSLPDWSADH
jgi:hypothetical protein